MARGNPLVVKRGQSKIIQKRKKLAEEAALANAAKKTTPVKKTAPISGEDIIARREAAGLTTKRRTDVKETGTDLPAVVTSVEEPVQTETPNATTDITDITDITDTTGGVTDTAVDITGDTTGDTTDDTTDETDPAQTRSDKLEELFADLFGDEFSEDFTTEGALQILKDRQAQSKTSLEKSVEDQIKQQKLVKEQFEESQLTNKEKLDRQKGAETVALASESLQGASTTGGLRDISQKGFDTGIKQLNRAQEDFKIREGQLDRAIEEKRMDLSNAQRDQKRSFAVSVQQEIDELENEKLRLQSNLQEQERAARTEARQAFQGAFQTITSLPAQSIAGLGQEGITKFFEAQGAEIDPVQAAGFATEFQKVADLEASSRIEDQEMAKLKKQQIQQSLQSGAEQAVQQVQQLQEAVRTGSITQEQADQLSTALGFRGKAETPMDLAKRKQIELENQKIKQELSPSSSGRALNLGEISTGEPLSLFSLGQGSRADRHNNPVASKAYPATISLLKSAGLEEGVDFSVGETTEGIDSDSVATIAYNTPEAGVRGAIATLSGGQLGSWYVSPSYAGSPKILSKISQLTGKKATYSNAQDIFNEMSMENQTSVVKEIYRHEGGTQLFKDPVTFGMSDITIFNNNEARNTAIKTKEGRAKFDAFTKEKNAVMNDPDASLDDVLKFSSGGKDLTDTPTKKLEQFSSVFTQLEDINKSLGKQETGPVIGRLRGMNPYDVDAQFLEAQLNSLIPGLARGVYGEVGVLTDNDIKLYKKTVPNLKAPNELNKVIMAMTLKKLQNGYKGILQAQAAAGRDVSGFGGMYSRLQNQIDGLLQEATGIVPEEERQRSPVYTQDQLKAIRQRLQAELDAGGNIDQLRFELEDNGIDPNYFFK